MVVTPNGPVRYERDVFYDANDNVVREDVQNIDADGALQANTHFTTVREYDILNHVVRTCREKGDFAVPAEQLDCSGLPPSEFVTTEYGYTANRKRSLVRSGEAVNGNDPDNVVQTLFDERALVFRTIRAPGHTDQASEQHDYDGNRNQTRLQEGLEAKTHVTIYAFDGYDRRTSATDPMGNVASRGYDANGNSIHAEMWGQLVDMPGRAGNVLLREASFAYDNLDRLTETQQAFFDPATQTPISDGASQTQFVWSDASLLLQVVDDNGHIDSAISYDTALRRGFVTDAAGNTRTYAYDSNSNVLSVVEFDLSDLGLADQEFTTTYEYDGLDRRTRAIDNVGNITVWHYDSRRNIATIVDQRGNTTLREHDGLNRRRTTWHVMTDTGNGEGTPIGQITTSQEWNDNNRITARIDDNANRTEYAYDALNRRTMTEYADCTQVTVVYDVHGQIVQKTDGNGTVAVQSYDLNNRPTVTIVLPGPGVSDDTTFEIREYEGRGLIVSAEDDDTHVTMSWDSLGNCNTETVSGETTLRTFDGVGNKLTCTYPGGRVIAFDYDAIDNLETVSDGSTELAVFWHVGSNRVERVHYGNGTRLDLTWDGITGAPNDPGDFGVKHVSRTTHTRVSDPALLDDRKFACDPAGNNTVREELISGALFEYGYDSVNRLVRTVRTPPGTPGGEILYNLDGVGNRQEVTGGPDPGLYTMNQEVCDPADSQMNRYTTTLSDFRDYDDNANLVSIDGATEKLLAFAYRARLVRNQDADQGIDVSFVYDTFGRRIAKTVSDNGQPTSTHYFYDGWRVIEERTGDGTTTATYVYGTYIDNVISMRRDAQDFFYHVNDMNNVVAISDQFGDVVERYAYTDYGVPSFYDSKGSQITESAVGNPYLYTGRRFDSESGWYYYRMRYLAPKAGRFITRDPIGIWGDTVNLGNGTAYVGNNPWSAVDPVGLDAGDIPTNVGGHDYTFTAIYYPACYWDCLEDCGKGVNWKSAAVGVWHLTGGFLIEFIPYLGEVIPSSYDLLKRMEEVIHECEEACDKDCEDVDGDATHSATGPKLTLLSGITYFARTTTPAAGLRA